MAFENLTNRLNMALRRFVHKDYLNPSDIDEMMRDVRLSLLEADCNIKVVDEFINETKEIALGEKIIKGLNPGQQVIKVVNDELVKLMGSTESSLNFGTSTPSVFMMVGLQGAGKTTHAAKLANYIKKNYSKKVMLVACDIYRPAAIEQLKILSDTVGASFYEEGLNNPVDTAKHALIKAKEELVDVVIIDTAGRLEIDEPLIKELKNIKSSLNPSEVILTVDSMMGQAAAQVSDTFNKEVGITSVILTKLDGDQRGGAALTVKKMTGVPIKFSGTGEKIDDIEVFYPERIASRILGMGDVLTLIEKAEDAIDENESKRLMEKMMDGSYDYNDLVKQMKLINKMGKLSGLLKMIPGMSNLTQLKDINDDAFDFIEVVVKSMTKEERKDPSLIAMSSSRKRRIAYGSGRSLTDVNKVEQMLEKQKKTFKMLSNMDPSKLQDAAEKLGSGNFNPFNPFGKK